MSTPFFSLLRSAFGAVVAILISSSVYSQERQVSFDSAHALMRIDKGIEHSLSLFPGVDNFQEAYLYQKPDSSYVVQITRDSSHVITRINLPWSEAQRDSALVEISDYARKEHPELYLNQEGRGTLMIGIMGLSLLGYGPSVPVMLGMSDPAQITGAYLLLGGGSFLLASSMTSTMEITKGEASFATSGGIIGYGHGALLTLLLEGENPDAKSAAAISSLTSIGELVVNYGIAKRTKMTPGTASLMNSGALLGGLYGLGTSFMFSEEPEIRSLSALTLGGSIGGYFVGDLLARDHSYEEGDATAVTLAATIGALVPLSNMLAGGTTDHTALSGLTIAGSVAGGWIAHNATRNTGFTSSQGAILSLGTFAGTLMGTGFALLAKSDGQAGVMLASLGTIAGYGITFGMLANTKNVSPAGSTEGRSMGARIGADIRDRLEIHLNPAAIVTAARSNDANNRIVSMAYHL